MRFNVVVLYLLLLLNYSVNAQSTDSTTISPLKITANKMWNLDVLVSGDLPMADMAKRFGANYRVGLGIKYKTENNWIFGVKGEFIITNKVREDSLLQNVKTAQGSTISLSGDLLNIGVFGRGYIIGLQAGKIIPKLQINVNSGPTLLTSVGFMQHKIRLFDRDNAFPQLKGDYKKGYDRLTNGIYIEQFIGYSYFSVNKLINFYAGFHVTWGFTKGRRDYLFDVARTDNARRNDILTGFKFGWVLPMYKKNVEETYY
jgi:hypothetical protein